MQDFRYIPRPDRRRKFPGIAFSEAWSAPRGPTSGYIRGNPAAEHRISYTNLLNIDRCRGDNQVSGQYGKSTFTSRGCASTSENAGLR